MREWLGGVGVPLEGNCASWSIRRCSRGRRARWRMFGTLPPEEAAFWERVRFALRGAGYELLITAHYWAQEPMDVPVLRARNGLSAVRTPERGRGWEAWLTGETLDAEPFLERERLWHGPADEAGEAVRREAVRHFVEFYAAALREARPVLLVLWNGQHPQEMILEALCRQAGCPVLYLERGPFQGTLQVDGTGILAGSAVARDPEWHWSGGVDRERWHARYDALAAAYRSEGSTWWTQPGTAQSPSALRQRLGIAPEAAVVLFAGQVDRDAQNLLFSPHFEDNLDAFCWFCESLPRERPVFVVGKHHPKSEARPAAFRDAARLRGTWVTDVALGDALAVSDRVAAVNSTVLYEALLMELPVLMLGESLLSGKGIAYTAGPGDTGGMRAWLDAADFPERHARWRDFAAYLLAEQLYAMREQNSWCPRGAKAFAERLLMDTAQDVDYSRLPRVRGLLDATALWDDCRARNPEHAGFKEVLRGCNIALRASLGRAFPRLYRGLVRLGDAVYARITGPKYYR